jgi:hypothetical protein
MSWLIKKAGDMRKTDVVVTTIFEPEWLAGYLDNMRQYARENDVVIRIIADKKTPPSVFEVARQAVKNGFKIDCPSLDEQESYIQRLGLPSGFIPWNTDNRRNIGFLRAWESGADVLVSIDDDNYCLPGSDFVGAHHVVGQTLGELENADYARDGKWFNICSRLRAQVKDNYYARGFPYAARAPEHEATIASLHDDVSQTKIAVNAGLWLDDPDVDAMSRLVQGPRVTSADPRSVVLAPEVWSPVNTQNTALVRDAIPAYYYVRMGFPIQGMKIDRFGDILSGYFLQKCAKHLGHAIRFGDPIAEHRRSPHNLFKDLFHELAGRVVIEDMLPWLRELKLEGGNYREAYASLADAIYMQADRFNGFIWDDGGREFLKETAECMRLWLHTIDRLDGKGGAL